MNPATPTDVAAELLRHSFRIAALEVETAKLARERAPENGSTLEAVQVHEAVLAMSRELFPLGISTEFERDAETGESYCVVNAKVKGTVDDLVLVHAEWHHRLVGVADLRALNYRLSLDLQ